MKRIIVFTACTFNLCSLYAQQHTTTQTTTVRTSKTIVQSTPPSIGGIITDTHKRPILNAKVFIYLPDSSIIGSGYTDGNGNFETNTVAPGNYAVKIVYPSSVNTLITGVVIKNSRTMINLASDVPTTDSVIPYSELNSKAITTTVRKK